MGKWGVVGLGVGPGRYSLGGVWPLWTGSACLTAPLLLQVNGLAAQGKYEGGGEDGGAAAQSLYIANHAY